MPLSRYFKGKGKQVMSDMQDRYGADKGKSVFYATANKQGMTANDSDADDMPAPKPKRGGLARFGKRGK